MMKRIAFLILTSFLSALFFNIVPVFAVGKVKVYYSESLGTGEKVYRLTTCQKVPAMGVVTCSQGTIGQYPKQCDGSKDIGNPIYGCLKRKVGDGNTCAYTPGGSGDICNFTGTDYPQVDTAKFALKAPQGCSDKPDDQAPLYGKLLAVIPTGLTAAEQLDESNINRTVVLHEGETFTPLPEEANKVEVPPKPMYQTGLCAQYDVPENNQSEAPPADVQKLLCKVGAADAAAARACDNDPSAWQGFADQVKGLFIGESGAACDTSINSSKLDPTRSASCSYVERITGDNGADIIGKYIGMLYRWAAGIIGIVAVLGIVYSGIQMSVAAGNTALVDEAKSHIGKALLAIAILFLSGLILYTINPTFFTGG